MSLDPSKYAPIPAELNNAVEAGDVWAVLRIWAELIEAIPGGQDPTSNPLWYAALYADAMLPLLVERYLLTYDQMAAPRFSQAAVNGDFFVQGLAHA